MRTFLHASVYIGVYVPVPSSVIASVTLMSLLQIAWLPLAVFLDALLWLLWRYLRSVLVRSPLDNIRGPSSPSFIQGEPYAYTATARESSCSFISNREPLPDLRPPRV